MHEQKSILVVNAGSSSLKVGYYRGADSPAELSVVAGLIGMNGAYTKVTKDDQNSELETSPQMSYEDVTRMVFGFVASEVGNNVSAVGHRVVHGGMKFTKPAVLDEGAIQDLHSLALFDRVHMEPALNVIRIAGELFPDSTHIACFDTAFFTSMSEIAQLLPIPRRYIAQGFKRYGFHGLSYEYLTSTFEEICGKEAAMQRVVYAHLGSGVSLTAVVNGQPVDTTMGLTPGSGVPMSTRSGSVDPGIFELLHSLGGLEYDAIGDVLTKESGLLGVSERSADMYELLQAEESDWHAKEAVDLFCYEVKKSIGALSAAIGGLDSIVIAGGMGENAPLIRARMLGGLEYLGVELDSSKNYDGQRCISSDTSRVGVHVIHTDEARVIARHVYETIGKTSQGNEEL